MIKKLGGKLQAYYFAVGQPKYYAICEFPDPVDTATLAAIGIGSMAKGAITSGSITQLLTSAEMVKSFQKAGEMDYRFPA